MQRSKVRISIIMLFLLVFTLIFAPVVNSDVKENWMGYGLYNISGSDISIINEDVAIELQNDKLAYNGEFLIRNHSSQVIKASLGMPVQGIDQIAFTERNSVIKWKKRSFGSLQNEFAIENRTPQEDWWYIFSLSLNPGETKLVNIKLEDVRLPQEQGVYTFTYFNDRKLGYSNHVEKASLFVSFSDFQPYNIMELKGIVAGQLGVKGDIVYHASADKLGPLTIKYMDVTKVLMDKMMSSAMYKPREIALAFTNKNFNKVYTLCDEYIKSPSDSQISIESVQFLKAESFRCLQNYEKYLAIVEGLDFTKLYPLELKNKILLDRMTIYLEQQNQEKLYSLYKEFDLDESESMKYLKNLIESSNAYGAIQVNQDSLFKQLQQEPVESETAQSVIQQWYQRAIEYKYTPALLFISGLVLGLTLRSFRFKRKRKKSMYLYRM